MREMDGGAAVFFSSSFLEFCRFSPNFLAVFSWFSRSFLSFSHSFLLVFNCEKTQENGDYAGIGGGSSITYFLFYFTI